MLLDVYIRSDFSISKLSAGLGFPAKFTPRWLGLQRSRQVGQCRRLKIIHQPLTDGLVQIVLRARLGIAASTELQRAAGGNIFSINRADDLHQRNGMRGSSQAEPAAAAFGADQNAR